MFQFTYKLKITERIKAKCERHPRYNPETPLERRAPSGQKPACADRGEDTKRNLKHAKDLRDQLYGCGAIALDDI